MKEFTTGLQHIGIPAKDYEKSAKFYETLGFTKRYETLQPNGKKVGFFDLCGLEMEIYDSETTANVNGAIDHIALNCTDIEAAYEKALSLGVTMTSDGIESLPYWDNGIRFFHFAGPDNERIEYCQIL